MTTENTSANLQEDDDLDALMGAMTLTKSADDIKGAVKAEDIPLGSGIDYSQIFFEPEMGKSYTVKLIRNVVDGEGNDIVHRKIYKNLPDPKRKGKAFQSVSSNKAATDKVLELFFELNNLKKNGDVLATEKLDEFMGVTNQGAVIVQILGSPETKDIGNYRIMTFSTFGPNASIANLINEKQNPSKEKLDAGIEKEDLFDLFESSTLFIQCDKAMYEGREGRDFSKSSWLPKKRGAFVKLDDGNQHVFTPADKGPDGKLLPAAIPAFKVLIGILKAPNLSIHNYFAYKVFGDPKNTEDTNKYLEELKAKVDEIVPIIKNAASIAEIKNYGVGGSTEGSDSAQMIGTAKAKDILAESAPSELMGSVLNASKVPDTSAASQVMDASPAAGLTQKNPAVDDILGEN